MTSYKLGEEGCKFCDIRFYVKQLFQHDRGGGGSKSPNIRDVIYDDPKSKTKMTTCLNLGPVGQL